MRLTVRILGVEVLHVEHEVEDQAEDWSLGGTVTSDRISGFVQPDRPAWDQGFEEE